MVRIYMFKQNLFWLSLSILTASILNASISFGSDNDGTATTETDKAVTPASDSTTTTETSKAATPAGESTTTTETNKAIAPAAAPDLSVNTPAVSSATAQQLKTEMKEAVAPKPEHKTTKLYGRIEQIAGQSGAQFPVVLQAMTAKMDTRKPAAIKGSAAENMFSGSTVSSFPVDYRGTWSGNLTVWQAQFDPICWQIDPEEVNRTRALIKPGAIGQASFQFRNDAGNKISLEPTQVVFMVPIKDTRYQEEFGKMLSSSGQSGGMTIPGINSSQMGTMMQQMMANMNVPIMLNFGEVNGSMGEEGLSGNAFRSKVLKNDIRQLSPTVLEQQIVTSEVQQNKKTGSTRNEYSETVIRFTKQSANQLYVQAASVNYTAAKRFERKFILYGTISHGATPANNANPLSGAGFGNLFGLPGGAGMPKLPAGQNPLQNLFNPQQ